MAKTIFFSWQGDTPNKTGRNLIEAALAIAVKRINAAIDVQEATREGLEVDKDTKGVPGSPPIFDTILGKIENTTVFVPDVTYVAARSDGRPVPNPNVLIEYGWALRALGHSRIVGVMNTAYGGPEELPFDLAHHRYPICFMLPADAEDLVRREVKEKLASMLESALRRVLDSEAANAAIDEIMPPKHFEERTPSWGRARFRTANDPVGVTADPIDRLTGKEPVSVYLTDGPAMWLRVMPVTAPERRLRLPEIQEKIHALATLPLLDGGDFLRTLRGRDGVGICRLVADRATNVAYVFSSGEVWILNTVFLAVSHDSIWLDERHFSESLRISTEFLGHVGVEGPYRWIAGMEGVNGRFLSAGDHWHARRGPCLSDLVEDSGAVVGGADVSTSLLPFFEDVFEQCGAQRARRTGSD